MAVDGIMATQAAAAVEAASLRTLMDTLGLRLGQSVAAKVVAMIADDTARLMIGETMLDVRTAQALPAGQTLTMTVARQGQELRLLLAQPPAEQPPGTTAAAPAATRAATPAGAAASGGAARGERAGRGAATPAGATGLVDGAQATLVARAGSPVQGRTAEPAEPRNPREALIAAVRAAAPKQEGMASLFADLAALTEGRAAPAAAAVLPEAVAKAIATVLGFRLPAGIAGNPAVLARAVAVSGTFLESTLATLAEGEAPPPDLKAALADLRRALADWARQLGLPDEAGRAAPGAGHERPPLRGALPHGQPPAASDLRPDANAGEIAARLLERTEAALARLTLLQAASLPDPREVRADAPVQTVAEVPLRLGEATAMVQFQIVRERAEDEAGRPAGAAKAGDWTLRLSMEAEPLGPVHAAVRWRDGHVGVHIWAEKPGVAEGLAAARDNLAEALEASAFTVDRLVIAAGRPSDPRRDAPEPAHRLDVTS